MGGTRLDHFPVTGTAVEGAVLPDFHKAVELAVRAHRAVGDYGILGADILLSDRGPIVNEVNANPFHTVYQSAFSRGILNPDFLPRLRAVRARFRHVTPRPKLGPLA
jgi:Sugar-transfer associated ATP-grasp